MAVGSGHAAARPALVGLASVIEAAALVTAMHERYDAAMRGAALPEGTEGAWQQLHQALELLRRAACRTDVFASISERGAQ